MAVDEAGTLATARVKLVADARNLPGDVQNQTQKGLGDAGAKAGTNFGKRMTAAIAASLAVGAAIVGKKLVDGLKSSIAAASDLNEVTSKVSVVFGKSAKDVQKFADTAATALGQSKTQALTAASTFAVFGKGANLSGKELVKFSTGLVKTSADMASFSNSTPEEAIAAIGSALRGEFDPIERYGVLLNETNVKAEALSSGLLKGSVDVDKVRAAQLKATVAQRKYNDAVKEHGKNSNQALAANAGLIGANARLKTAVSGSTQTLTAQQRTLAVQSLIFKQTSDAQGDFARTSGGLANQQRILKAQIDNLKTSIGQALLPVVLKLTTILTSRVMPVMQELWQKHGPALTKFLDNAATKFGDFIGSIDADQIKQWAGDLKTFFANLRQEAGPALETIRANIGPAGQSIKSDLIPALKDLRANGGESLSNGIRVTGVALKFFADHSDLLAKALPYLVGSLVAFKVAQLGSNIAMALSPALRIAEVVATRQQTAAIVANTAARGAETVATGAGTAATAAGTAAENAGVVARSRAAVVAVAQRVATLAATAATWLATAASTALGVAVRFATGPIGIIITVIAAFVAVLIYAYKHNETFRRVVDAVWKAIKTAIKAVGDWFVNTLWPSLKRAIDQGRGQFEFLRKTIQAVWKLIAWYITTYWNIVKGVFNVLKTAITQTIPNAFKTGVAAIGRFWSGLQELARKPITFVVGIVNKLIRGYNKVAGVFNAPSAPEIPGFEKGGQIPGSPSDVDNLMAEGPKGEHIKLATGEYIVNARATARNLPLLQAVNSGAQGFADGGLFGTIKSFFSSPVKYVKNLAGNLGDIAGRFGNSGLVKTLTGMAKKLVDSVVDKAQSLFSFGGGAGSGMFGKWPSSPGAQRGDSGVWRAITAMIRSTGPISGAFGNGYRPGDPKWHGSGRAVDWMGYNQDALATLLAARGPLELIHRTSRRDYAYTRGKNKGSFNNALMEAHRNHIHIAFNKGGRFDSGTSRKFVPTFDNGGVLAPGINTVYNGTGGPEALTRTDQPMRLHPADLEALGGIIAREMRAAIGAGNYAAGQRASIYTRGG